MKKHKGDTLRVAEMLNRTSQKPKHFAHELSDDELFFIEGHQCGDGKLGESVRFEMGRRAQGKANSWAKWAFIVAAIAVAISLWEQLRESILENGKKNTNQTHNQR